MAETWSKLTPLDSANAKEGPARIRFIKTYIAALLAVEHTFTTGALTLTHNLAYEATEPAAGNINRWFYDSATGQIKRDNGTTWDAITPAKGIFAAGTKTVFCQVAAPTGWTKDTTHNDKMLRVVSSAGGGASGTWTFTTDSVSHTHAVLNTTITTTHTWSSYHYATYGAGATVYQYGSVLNNHDHSHSHSNMTEYSHSHTSDGVFRPQYVDVIICTKS